jgi:hypothetical protein
MFSPEAPIPLERRTPNSVVLVFDTNGLMTGVALGNLSGPAENITVTLRDDPDAPLPSLLMDFPPRAQIVA